MPHRPSPHGWRRLLPRHPRHLGKRGQLLLTLGLLWIVIGISTLAGTDFAPVLHHHLPNELGFSLWVATGLVAIAAALRPWGLPDHWGFSALYIMPTVRVASYTLAWVASWGIFPAPAWLPQYDQGWRLAAFYACQVAAVMICAGWPDPPGQDGEADG